MSTEPDLPQAEAAVRRYLQFLKDPASFVDHGRLEALRAQAAATDDVIEQVKVLSEAHRCEHPDGDELRAGFVGAARAFAAANGIEPEAFVQIGVDRSVLVEAGLLATPAAKRRGDPASDAPKARQGRVDDVSKHVVSRTGSFTLADIAEAVPGSPMTIRKAVSALVESGAVLRLGPKPDWHGQGRAPIVYRRQGTAG